MPDIEPSFVISSLMGCAAGYAAIKVEIKYIWRDLKQLKQDVKELIEKKAA